MHFMNYSPLLPDTNDIDTKATNKIAKKYKNFMIIILNNYSGFIQVEYETQTDVTLSQFYKFIIIDNFRASLKLKVVVNFRVKSFIDFVIIHNNFDFVLFEFYNT